MTSLRARLDELERTLHRRTAETSQEEPPSPALEAAWAGIAEDERATIAAWTERGEKLRAARGRWVHVAMDAAELAARDALERTYIAARKAGVPARVDEPGV